VRAGGRVCVRYLSHLMTTWPTQMCQEYQTLVTAVRC